MPPSTTNLIILGLGALLPLTYMGAFGIRNTQREREGGVKVFGMVIALLLTQVRAQLPLLLLLRCLACCVANSPLRQHFGAQLRLAVTRSPLLAYNSCPHWLLPLLQLVLAAYQYHMLLPKDELIPALLARRFPAGLLGLDTEQLTLAAQVRAAARYQRSWGGLSSRGLLAWPGMAWGAENPCAARLEHSLCPRLPFPLLLWPPACRRWWRWCWMRQG